LPLLKFQPSYYTTSVVTKLVFEIHVTVKWRQLLYDQAIEIS